MHLVAAIGQFTVQIRVDTDGDRANISLSELLMSCVNTLALWQQVIPNAGDFRFELRDSHNKVSDHLTCRSKLDELFDFYNEVILAT